LAETCGLGFLVAIHQNLKAWKTVNKLSLMPPPMPAPILSMSAAVLNGTYPTPLTNYKGLTRGQLKRLTQKQKCGT
jgi:hypothetical protein